VRQGRLRNITITIDFSKRYATPQWRSLENGKIRMFNAGDLADLRGSPQVEREPH
jgi:hypothetical protein